MSDIQRYSLIRATEDEPAYLELDPEGPWVLFRDIDELEAAARWLVKIYADGVPKYSALWEDLHLLRAALDERQG